MRCTMAEEKSSKGKWIAVIIIIVILGLISMVIAGIMSVIIGITSLDTSSTPIGSGNVALIPIKGVILTETVSSPFGGSGDTSSSDVVESIEKADKNPSIKAIVFEINSPGGSGVASDEIASAIKRSSKPTVSYVREVGASGAYWVASATDRIFVNRMSIVGSIGVIASYLEFSGFMQEYNITYERFVAGKYKDFGSPFRKPTNDERDLFQIQLDSMHDIFINEVATNRNMSQEKVRELATGFFFTGEQGINLGLVDEIGGKEEVKTYLEKELNMTIQFVEYKRKRTLLDLFGEMSSQGTFAMGKGIGTALVERKPQLSIYT